MRALVRNAMRSNLAPTLMRERLRSFRDRRPLRLNPRLRLKTRRDRTRLDRRLERDRRNLDRFRPGMIIPLEEEGAEEEEETEEETAPRLPLIRSDLRNPFSK